MNDAHSRGLCIDICQPNKYIHLLVVSPLARKTAEYSQVHCGMNQTAKHYLRGIENTAELRPIQQSQPSKAEAPLAGSSMRLHFQQDK